MKFTKNCLYCEEEFKTDFKQKVYYSRICGNRYNQRRQGRDAKPFQCHNCGEYFKRRSAKNTKCKKCRELLALGEKISNSFEDIPQLSREEELKMQEEWLKKNKVKKENNEV